MKEVTAEGREVKQCDGGGSNEIAGDEREKPGFLGVIKSGKGIVSLGRKGGTLTPVPTWKMESNDENGGGLICYGDNAKGNTVSARKLAANLWELQNVVSQTPPSDSARKMTKSAAKTGTRREKTICFSSRSLDSSHNLTDHHPTSTLSMRRQMDASFIEHQKTIDGNDDATLPESSASFCSSLEIAAYDHATPCRSLDIKGRHLKLSSNLRTSTELLKVLNRIWILEQKHASSVSKIKALKLERDHAQARVEDLILEQQEDRRRIDELTKRFAEEKLITKSRVQERIKTSVHSVKEELDEERKLRRKSESLHRKLARDIAEVKTTLSKTVKELGTERNTRLLVEDLCDELAKGVADYDQELRELTQKYEKEPYERDDRFVLRIAETWLDERVQIKLAEEEHDSQDNGTAVDRLQCEIETFLRKKQSSDSTVHTHTRKEDWLRRCSVESIPLNEAASGPQFGGHDDSGASESDCFDINRSVEDAQEVVEKDIYRSKVIAELEALMKPNAPQRRVIKYRSSCSSVAQLGNRASTSKSGSRDFFTERVVSTHAKNVNEADADNANQIEISICHRSDNCDMRDDNYQWTKQMQMQRVLHGNQFRSLPNCGVCQTENEHEEGDYTSKGVVPEDRFSGEVHDVARSMQPRVCRGVSPDRDLSESSSKMLYNSKENSLKAKLLEARLEGQQARLRIARGT